MIEQEDWVFRPVLKGMIKAESLIDGSIDLNFLALLNEVIDIEAENNQRTQRYLSMKRI